jgi:6-phosphogluconolactonase
MRSLRPLRSWLLLAPVLAAACGGSTPSEPSPAATPTPEAPAAGIFVYVGSREGQTISSFGVGQSTGALTPLPASSVTLTGRLAALAIDGAGRFAYVGMWNGPDALATYAIDRQTGALTAVPSSGQPAPAHETDPATGVGRLLVEGIVLHPSGRRAHVLYGYDRHLCGLGTLLYAYGIDPSTGRLTQLDRPPQEVGVGWASVVLSTSAGHLYSANRGYADGTGCDEHPELRGYTVDAGSGALRELASSPFAQGDPEPWSSGYNLIGLRPASDLLFVASDNEVARFRLAANTGAATWHGAAPCRVGWLDTPIPAGRVAAFSPAGRLYAATNNDGPAGIQAFDVRADTGDMTPIPSAPFATPGRVNAITIDASGRFLYAAQLVYAAQPLVSAFAIDPATGVLRPAPGSPIEVGRRSDDLTVAIANVR